MQPGVLPLTLPWFFRGNNILRMQVALDYSPLVIAWNNEIIDELSSPIPPMNPAVYTSHSSLHRRTVLPPTPLFLNLVSVQVIVHMHCASCIINHSSTIWVLMMLPRETLMSASVSRGPKPWKWNEINLSVFSLPWDLIAPRNHW